jgi:hypothetical protein
MKIKMYVSLYIINEPRSDRGQGGYDIGRGTFLNIIPRDIQLTLSTIICSSILSLLPAVRMIREASEKSDSSMYVTGICAETCNIGTKNSE